MILQGGTYLDILETKNNQKNNHLHIRSGYFITIHLDKVYCDLFHPNVLETLMTMS